MAEAVPTSQEEHRPQNSSFAEEMAMILRELRCQWFSSQSQNNWPLFKRIVPSLFGSLTFFIAATFVRLSEVEVNQSETISSQIGAISNLIIFADLWIVILIIVFVYSVFFAYLASWRDSARGPVRLYFMGLLIPAITMVVVRSSLL